MELKYPVKEAEKYCLQATLKLQTQNNASFTQVGRAFSNILLEEGVDANGLTSSNSLFPSVGSLSQQLIF